MHLPSLPPCPEPDEEYFILAEWEPVGVSADSLSITATNENNKQLCRGRALAQALNQIKEDIAQKTIEYIHFQILSSISQLSMTGDLQPPC